MPTNAKQMFLPEIGGAQAAVDEVEERAGLFLGQNGRYPDVTARAALARDASDARIAAGQARIWAVEVVNKEEHRFLNLIEAGKPAIQAYGALCRAHKDLGAIAATLK